MVGQTPLKSMKVSWDDDIPIWKNNPHVPVTTNEFTQNSFLGISRYNQDVPAGWCFQPLSKILVSWDDYSQYMGKYKMFQTTNQNQDFPGL